MRSDKETDEMNARVQADVEKRNVAAGLNPDGSHPEPAEAEGVEAVLEVPSAPEIVAGAETAQTPEVTEQPETAQQPEVTEQQPEPVQEPQLAEQPTGD